MAAVVHRLQRLAPDVRPSEEFRASLRANLMAQIDREGIGVTAVNPDHPDPDPRPCRRRRMSARVAAGTTAAITVIAVGVGVAASSAIPGDGLPYDVKQTAEQARLDTAGTPIEQGRLYLEFARTRMAEADAETADSPELPAILDRMDNQTRQGVSILTSAAIVQRSTAPLDPVAGFAADQRRDMPDVLADITGTAHARAVISSQLIDTVARRVDDLRGSINCGVYTLARSDDLGPKLRPCTTVNRSDNTPDPVALTSASPSPTVTPTAPAPAPTPTPASPAPLLVPIPTSPVPAAPPPAPTPIDPPTTMIDPIPAPAASAGTDADGIAPADTPTDTPALADTIGGLLDNPQQ